MKTVPSSKKRLPPREQLFVARDAQGRLMFRAMLYCVFCCAGTGLLIAWAAATGPGQLLRWSAVGLAIVITVPLVMYDMARVSNRLVGPFARVHGAIRRLANRDPVEPLAVRDKLWSEWIEDFNIMLARVQPGGEHEPVEADEVGEGDRRESR